jgi:hypothetical protein
VEAVKQFGVRGLLIATAVVAVLASIDLTHKHYFAFALHLWLAISIGLVLWCGLPVCQATLRGQSQDLDRGIKVFWPIIVANLAVSVVAVLCRPTGPIHIPAVERAGGTVSVTGRFFRRVEIDLSGRKGFVPDLESGTLVSLNLSNSGIRRLWPPATNRYGPAGLRLNLHDHKYLSKLNLSGNVIDDLDLLCVARLSRLEELSLRKTLVGDDGIRSLAELKRLRVLSLEGTLITDASAPDIADFDKLEVLRLDNTSVSDKALRYIAQMDQLRILSLNFTQVSPTGLKNITKRLPECRIICSPKTLQLIKIKPNSMTEEWLRRR